MTIALVIALTAHNLYRWGQITFLTSVKGLSVGLGRQSPDEYLGKARNLNPNPSFGAFMYIDGLKLRKDEKILMLADPKIFYSSHFAIANTVHDIPVAFAWANAASDPRELFQKLASENISVIVSNKTGISTIESSKYVNEHSLGTIRHLLEKYFNKVYEDEWAVVFQARALHP